MPDYTLKVEAVPIGRLFCAPSNPCNNDEAVPYVDPERWEASPGAALERATPVSSARYPNRKYAPNAIYHTVCVPVPTVELRELLVEHGADLYMHYRGLRGWRTLACSCVVGEVPSGEWSRADYVEAAS